MASSQLQRKIDEFRADFYSCTKVDIIETRYVWKIKNLLYLTKLEGIISSPTFTSNRCRNDKWQLHILRDDNCEVYLQPSVSSSRPKVFYKFKYSVIGEGGSTLFADNSDLKRCLVSGFKFTNAEDMIAKAMWKFNVGAFSTLNLFCTIQTLKDITVIPYDGFYVVPSVQKDYSSFLTSGQHSDVTLSVKGGELRAHKIILSSQSTVFAAMFEHKDMEENKTNRVVIDDFEENVIAEMLQFIYTGTSPNIENMALELLPVADKYAVDGLKKMCGSVLERTINEKSALNILIIADRHDVDKLKIHALQTIKHNISTISKTDEWQKFYLAYPNLLIDLLDIK